MSRAGSAAIHAEDVTIADGEAVLCRNVSLSVPPASAFALMGQPRAAQAFLQCLAGRRRAASGSIRLLGIDPGSRWRLRSRRLFVPADRRIPELGSERYAPELMLLENPAPNRETRLSLRRAVSAGMTLFLTTVDSEIAADIADQIGILARGRLLWTGAAVEVAARFRRVRFMTRVTEARTSFGTELDEFDAVRVRVRGWGVEAVVSNFDEAAFERLRAREDVSDVESEPMTLSEILEACRVDGD